MSTRLLGIVLAFAEAINRQSAVEIARLITDDHVFIDPLGARISGREPVRAAWTAYFRMVPDYSITIDEIFEDGDAVMMQGTAQGTFTRDGALKPENHWVVPAAWRVTIRESQIAEWRVFADNDPLRKIMARQI